MSNVWTSIACRAPCMSRQPRRAPLLHLFTGFARSQPFQPLPWNTPSTRKWTSQSTPACRRHLSSTSSLADKVMKNAQSAKVKTSKAVQANPRITTTAASGAGRPPNPPTYAAAAAAAAGKASPSEPKLEAPPTSASHTEGVAEDPEPLTWRDYDPEGGMPPPNGELTQPEINAVFNSEEVNVDIGNYILSVMHWRRLSGALIDVGLDFPKDSGVDRDMALRGLQHVRYLVPDVDENAAGQTWAEEEAQRMQQELQERAVKLGFYKAEEQQSDYVEEESEQGTEQGRERTGTSALQQMRQDNEARWEQEQKEQVVRLAKAEQTMSHMARGPLELAGKVQPPPPKIYLQSVQGQSLTLRDTFNGMTTRPMPAWKQKYVERATLSHEPDVSKTIDIGPFKRFGPSTLVVLLVLAGGYLSENYSPSPNSARLWPDTPPSQATLIGITGVLVAAFILGRMPPLWRFWNKYMCFQTRFPYALGLVGAAFRHDTLVHLLANLAVLWVSGLYLHEDVGRGTFLAIYLISGVCGSFTSFAFHALKREWTIWGMGSSNCMLGMASALCTLHPVADIKILGFESPCAWWVVLALYLGSEAFAGLRGLRTGIDHMGHVGGMLTGIGLGMYVRSKFKGEQITRIENPDAIVQTDKKSSV